MPTPRPGVPPSYLDATAREITVSNVPGSWTTNLCDDDVREFHALHDAATPGEEIVIALFTTRLRFRFVEAMVSFKEGACHWTALNDRHIVIYRTHHEWELWNARRQELAELREEQEQERAVELQLLRTDDAHFFQLATAAAAHGDHDAAAVHFCARAEARRRFAHLGHVASIYYLVDDTLRRMSRFPSSSYGVAFLLEYHPFASSFSDFARSFMCLNRLPAAQKHAEIERIHDAAIARFEQDGTLFKDVCLFWRRHGRLDLAIRYCQTAVARGVSDDTKSGFAGRLRRLQSEHASAA